MTVYPVIGEPPFDVGALHDTTLCAFATEPNTFEGEGDFIVTLSLLRRQYTFPIASIVIARGQLNPRAEETACGVMVVPSFT